MTQVFGGKPEFKLECSGETYINDAAVAMTLTRPENNVSTLVAAVTDYRSEKFVDIFDTGDVIDLSLRYRDLTGDSWTKVFTGIITSAQPRLASESGELLDVVAWGYGLALMKTHCNTSYGVESANNTKDTPKEILDDLLTNYINLSFGGASTAWGLTNKIEDVHNGLSVTHLNSPYDDNLTVINKLCDVVNAYAVGAAAVSIHYYVDPSKNLYVKKIDADHTDGNWDRYYKGSQAASTLTVKEDMVLYGFKKNTDEYANRIVMPCPLRKPGYDYITENQSGQWDTDTSGTAVISVNDDNGAGEYVVGSYSIRCDCHGTGTGWAYYPASEDWGLDITKCESFKSVPTLNFYFKKDGDFTELTSFVDLCTTDHDSDVFACAFSTFTDPDNEWIHRSLPIGNYWKTTDESRRFRWGTAGAPSWSTINCINFRITGAGEDDATLWIDDLHISGKIIREAYDASELPPNAGKIEHQRVIRNDAAVDDTLKASDDSGTAARLCYAELLRRSQTPIVGLIQTPMIPDLLPGQTMHIHACKQHDGGTCAICGAPGTFRIAQDFRVKELKHVIAKEGFLTTLNLTSDVTNTHAFGVPNAYSLLKEYAGSLAHSEAKNLKGGGIDNLIPRLSKSY